MKDYIDKKRLRLAEKQKELKDESLSADVDAHHVLPTRHEVTSDS